MFKIILVLCAILAVTKGDNAAAIALKQDSNLGDRTDNYINFNRIQYAKVLEDYDTKMNAFREHYSGRIKGVNIQLEMVTASIVQIEERLNPMEVLSDFSKQCAIRYRSSIPTVLTAKTSIQRCIDEATGQVAVLLNSPLGTRNTLQNYHVNYFEKEIANCGKTYDNRTSNYTICVTAVTTNTNTYTISNQKTFEIQMDAAECTATANIKKALDCSYTIQSSTISKIAEANVLINNCLAGKDECRPCNECSQSYELKLDYKNETILNPFYGRDSNVGCLLLKLH